MEGRLVLKNCALFRPDGRVRAGMAVVVEGAYVTRVAPDAEVPVLPGDWEVACRGRLVSPGLVDAHAHLVGAQLVPPSGEHLLRPAAQQGERERQLARHLTAEDVEALTAFALARALRLGVTLTVEHLAGPGADVAQALAAQARAAERVGARLVTGHAALSGDGDWAGQLQASADFVRAHRGHPLVRGALGFWSSSLADDALLRRLGRLREELGAPVVFHLAESEDDLTRTWGTHGRRVVPRLEAFGLLGPGVVAAHARHLDRAEVERLADSRTLVALHPHAAALAERTGGGEPLLGAQHVLAGLGTGAGGTLWDEAYAAQVGVLQQARAGRLLDPEGALAHLLLAASELRTLLYGAPSGEVEEGRLADLVVFDHVAPDGAHAAGAVGLLTALGQAPAAWTVVHGRVAVREGALLGEDYTRLAAAAAEALERVYARAAEAPAR